MAHQGIPRKSINRETSYATTKVKLGRHSDWSCSTGMERSAALIHYMVEAGPLE